MEVMPYLEQIRYRIEKHISELKLKENSAGKNLVKPFEVIYSKVNIAISITVSIQEKLGHFKTDRPVTPKQIWAQALKTVYRDFLFVATMSTIEYYFSQLLLQCPNYETTQKIQKKGIRSVTMRDLINWASKERILGDYELWDFTVSARNDVVHHDAIAKHTKKSPIRDFPIEMTEGQQLSGKLRSLLSLTKHVEESFFNMVHGLKE
jgi:hypothetical protein